MLNQVVLVGRLSAVNQKERQIKLKCADQEITLNYQNDQMNTWLNDEAIGNIIGIKGKLTENNKVIIERVSFVSHG